MNLKLGTRAFLFFLSLGLLAARAGAQGVGQVVLERTELFTQCTPSRPDTTFVHHQTVEAFVFPVYNGSVLSGTLTAPGGASVVLSNNGSVFGCNFPLDTPSPAGTYAFSLDTAQGLQNLKVSLPGPAKGFLPLRFANYPEAQQVDATQDFNLMWDKAPRLNPHDRLFLQIVDTNGTPVFSSNALDLATTNAVVPAGTFQPNTTYFPSIGLRHYFKEQTASTPYIISTEWCVTRCRLKTLNPAGLFRFALQPVLAWATNGTATVTVERTEGSTQEATVDYFTTDDTAASNVNYVAVSGTLDFPPGVTTQTISVPLLDDLTATQALYFHLTLTNATGGAALVVRPHTTVTVLAPGNDPGTNVSAYLLSKVRFYSQTSTNLPTQTNLCDTARFFVSIHPKFPGAVTNALLYPPKGPGLPITNQYGFMEYQVDFSSAALRDKAFAGGVYKLAFDTVTEGSFAPKLTLGAERAFPVAHMSNWQDLQTADPSAPVTLQWDAFQGATDSDCVRVGIRDSAGEYVLRSPAELETGALPASTNSYTIPAGKLDYGQTYVVDLVFCKIKEAKQVYPGVRNGMVCIHTTSCNLHTIASAATPALRLAQPPLPCPCLEGQLPH